MPKDGGDNRILGFCSLFIIVLLSGSFMPMSARQNNIPMNRMAIDDKGQTDKSTSIIA
jgi:hypothetical protein